MSRIGFVLLTHTKPHQIQRLVTRLTTMFDNPPIVIHHDFGKCPLSDDFLDGFSSDNIAFVRPHLNTGWAEFSVVEATVRALTQMYRRADAPDWCVVLSGACYPTKPAAQILADFMSDGCDAFISGRKIVMESLSSDWHRKRYRRYCVKRFRLPFVSRRVPLPEAIGRYLLPFSEHFQCYAGSQWFTVGRRAAEYIIDFQQTSTNKRLSNHYRKIYKFPEESYFQTILYNAPHLTLQFDNRVYLDWSEQKPHPKQLTLADLTMIKASTAHFARKIDIDSDSDLLDALDRIIDGDNPLPVSIASISRAE